MRKRWEEFATRVKTLGTLDETSIWMLNNVKHECYGGTSREMKGVKRYLTGLDSGLGSLRPNVYGVLEFKQDT